MKPAVILVRPQMGENIGAVARAMSNFGLEELRLVNPRDGWPNKKAQEMASGGGAIIEAAKVYKTFPEALEGIQHVYATTARPRDMEKPVMVPRDAMQKLTAQQNGGWRTALVFGPERTGMENSEIAICDTIVSIPTSPKNPSLNLGQASVLLGYEWWQLQDEALMPEKTMPDVAPREDWNGLFGQLEEYLDEVNFYRVEEKKTVMWHNVQTMLLRAQWSAQEVRSMRGMLRAIWEKRRMKN